MRIKNVNVLTSTTSQPYNFKSIKYNNPLPILLKNKSVGFGYIRDFTDIYLFADLTLNKGIKFDDIKQKIPVLRMSQSVKTNEYTAQNITLIDAKERGQYFNGISELSGNGNLIEK